MVKTEKEGTVIVSNTCSHLGQLISSHVQTKTPVSESRASEVTNMGLFSMTKNLGPLPSFIQGHTQVSKGTDGSKATEKKANSEATENKDMPVIEKEAGELSGNYENLGTVEQKGAEENRLQRFAISAVSGSNQTARKGWKRQAREEEKVPNLMSNHCSAAKRNPEGRGEHKQRW